MTVPHELLSNASSLATVVIDRPEKRNALTLDMMRVLRADIAAYAAQPTLRALIVTGAEGTFCAGVDVHGLGALTTPEQARALITTCHELCQACRDCAVPVIAAIEGPCLGAGLELAAACDIRVAGEGAIFGMPEVRLGLPSVIEAALLPRLMGAGPAAALLYTGVSITTADAYRWGLVTTVAPPGGALAAATQVAHEIAANGPQAVRTQKALLRHWETAPLPDAIAHSIDVFTDTYSGTARAEPREGTAAWSEKRPPSWAGKASTKD